LEARVELGEGLAQRRGLGLGHRADAGVEVGGERNRLLELLGDASPLPACRDQLDQLGVLAGEARELLAIRGRVGGAQLPLDLLEPSLDLCQLIQQFRSLGLSPARAAGVGDQANPHALRGTAIASLAASRKRGMVDDALGARVELFVLLLNRSMRPACRPFSAGPCRTDGNPRRFRRGSSSPSTGS
jgi:hypothetical protein